MREWVCLNGQLLPAEEARISVFDSGLMQGIGLFETMRAYGGSVFRLQQHLDRLAASAKELGWAVVPDIGEMTDSVRQVVEATDSGDLRVRLTVTTGSLRVAGQEQPELTLIATASPGGKYPDELYQKGVSVVVPGLRQSHHDPTVGHKTTSYFSRLAALRVAHARGAFESLWLTLEGSVAEGSISSLFAVKDGELITPPLDTPVLPGITRAAVMELAERMSITVEPIAPTLEELLAADEVFLTNSMMEVMPVVRVGRELIGDEKPGELTRKLAVAYSELVDRECASE